MVRTSDGITIFRDERKYGMNDKRSKKMLSEEIRLRRGNIDSYDKVYRRIIGAILQISRHFPAPPSNGAGTAHQGYISVMESDTNVLAKTMRGDNSVDFRKSPSR